MIKIIDDFKAIIPQYELFIVDIFGVIHDGLELYPKVFENIQEIAKQNKHFVFLSNAPRRAIKAEKALNNFGISKDMYDFVLTSGEFAFKYFKNLEKQNIIKKYYYLGPEKDRDLLAESKHIEVTTAKKADLAICTGLDPDQQVSDFMPQIEEIKATNLELHCINPDKFVHKQSGASHICAGAIAQKYLSMQGKVKYYGKPFTPIYEQILQSFPNIDKSKILCIGDGMETDIKGANQAGLTATLITSGMHVKELNTNIGTIATEAEILNLCKKYQAQPDFIAALF